MPALQLSKCVKCINPITDNGRIVAADLVVIWMNETDLRVVASIYKWSDSIVTDCRFTSKAYLPRWFTDFVYECYEQKSRGKGGNPVEYNLLKMRINSLYGMTCQKPCKPDIEEDYESGEFITQQINFNDKYEKYLKGINGKILTTTDARGIELDGVAEDRLEPEAGNMLRISLDYTMQKYALQMAEKVRTEKQADKVGIILMNPQNGEIYAMVNVPEFDLNQPFMLNNEETGENLTDEQRQDALNQMWRNGCINDTYEPGSTFKIITASAGLEEGAVHLTDQFSCPGYKVVEDRRIRCHKVGGHGAENFVQGIQNSCNPVFIEVGLKIGVDRFFDYFRQFGLMDLTGVDIPGEAGTIMHKKENVGQVELATISFGQSFQITPIQLATTVSALVNGGRRVTPHFGMEVLSAEGKKVKTFRYNAKKHIVSEKTSQTMRELLESVVAEGSGKNAYVEGYRIGGKTATSQTLPRSANKYISSFVGFAPADDPQILGMCVIYNPQGVYYGGTIAAPVIGKIFENILPYLGIEKQ